MGLKGLTRDYSCLLLVTKGYWGYKKLKVVPKVTKGYTELLRVTRVYKPHNLSLLSLGLTLCTIFLSLVFRYISISLCKLNNARLLGRTDALCKVI